MHDGTQARACLGSSLRSPQLTQAGLQMNQTTKAVEYDGAVLNTVTAMAELAHGGQILMDQDSFKPIKSGLVQLRARTGPGPNLAALHRQCRHAPLLQSCRLCIHGGVCPVHPQDAPQA